MTRWHPGEDDDLATALKGLQAGLEGSAKGSYGPPSDEMLRQLAEGLLDYHAGGSRGEQVGRRSELEEEHKGGFFGLGGDVASLLISWVVAEITKIVRRKTSTPQAVSDGELESIKALVLDFTNRLRAGTVTAEDREKLNDSIMQMLRKNPRLRL